MPVSSSVDPNAFTDSLDRALAVLANGKQQGTDRMTAVEISEILQSSHGLRLHWRSINAELLKEPDLVGRKKKDGRWTFAILKKGHERIIVPPASISFVDPSKAVQAVVTLHDILSQCQGVVRVCDAYLDNVTLQHLDACTRATEIKLLTRNVKDSGALRALYAAFGTQGRKLSICVVAANVLHDRYIIDDKKMLILGTSLNGFGKKQCFVIEAGNDMRTSMLSLFDGHWQTATPWP